jgi:hypothetical protein
MARHEFFKGSELDWEVNVQPVLVGGIETTSYKGLTRSDNGLILDIHKESYNPFLNKDLIELYENIANVSGFAPMGFQEAKDGRMILGYLQNQSDTTQMGHKVNEYLVIGNSHDGSKGTFLGSSSLMIRCMNQFGRILRTDIVKHTVNRDLKLDAIKRNFEIYFEAKLKENDIYNKLAKVSIDSDLLEALTLRLFDIEEREGASTRKLNQIEKFDLSVRTETSELGLNLFGFFNSVTHYTTHATNQKETVFGNLIGTNESLNTKAYKMVLEMA